MTNLTYTEIELERIEDEKIENYEKILESLKEELENNCEIKLEELKVDYALSQEVINKVYEDNCDHDNLSEYVFKEQADYYNHSNFNLEEFKENVIASFEAYVLTYSEEDLLRNRI